MSLILSNELRQSHPGSNNVLSQWRTYHINRTEEATQSVVNISIESCKDIWKVSVAKAMISLICANAGLNLGQRVHADRIK
jgi:hypothetical protein